MIYMNMKRHNNSQVFRRPTIEGAKYGAIAGLIATWSISTAIAASELELGLPIGTFYAVMGISLGFNDFIGSAYQDLVCILFLEYPWSYNRRDRCKG